MSRRLLRWLDTAMPVSGRLAIVAHAGPLRLLRRHLEGRALAERWSLSLAPCEIVEIRRC